MAALCTGNYGLSQNCTDNSKEYLFVKLTDSAYRAVEEYQRNQNKYNTRATIQISGNGGVLSFPSSCGNVGQQFSFSIDDIEGSFECIQQTQNQLDVLGALPYKMRIHANDDVYETTRHRMAVAEEYQKNKCTREIKPNQTDIGRKVKLKNSFNRAINIPPKRDQPLTTSPISSSTSTLNSMSSSTQHNSNGNGGISTTSLSPLLSSSSNNGGIVGGVNSGSYSSNNINSPILNSSSNNSNSLGNNSSMKNSINNSNLSLSSSSSSSANIGQTAASSLSSALSSAAGSGSSGIATGSITSAMGNSYYNGNNSSSHPGLRTSNGLGNGNNSSSNRRGMTGGSGSNSNINRNQRNGGRSMPDITKRKIRERLIHLLALKPFKKPELYTRLQNEGIRDREKSLISNILKDISIIRDNSYNLKRPIWNDVNEDWPFYTEQEIQMLKRRKPQNLTPPLSSDGGSSTSGQSPTSTHNGSPPPAVKRPSSMNSDRFFEEAASKKQRISHYRKDNNEINRRSAIGANDYRDSSHMNHQRRDIHDRSSSYYGSTLPSSKHHEPEDHSMSLSYSVLGSDVARRISSREERMNGHMNNVHHNTINNNNSSHQHINNSNSSSNTNNSSLNRNSSNNANSNNSGIQHQNSNNYHHNSPHHTNNSISTRIPSNGSNGSKSSDSRRQSSSPIINSANIGNVIGASPPTGADIRTASGVCDDIMERHSSVVNNSSNDNNNNHRNGNSTRNSCSVSPNVAEQVTSRPVNYDFSSFTKITSVEQRRLYKTEFDNDYIEYRKLLENLDSVSKRFKMLDEQLRNETNNQNYEDITRRIVHEYSKFKKDKKYQQIKQRFSYLHAKLAHIKQLVSQFDKTLSKKIASSEPEVVETIGGNGSSSSSRSSRTSSHSSGDINSANVNSTNNLSKNGSSKTPPMRPTTPLSGSKSSSSTSSSLLSSSIGTTNMNHLPKQENY